MQGEAGEQVAPSPTETKHFLEILDHTHKYIHLDPVSDAASPRQSTLLLSPTPAHALGNSRASSLSLSPTTSASNLSFQTAMSHTLGHTSSATHIASTSASPVPPTGRAVASAATATAPAPAPTSSAPHVFDSPNSVLSGSISSPELSQHIPRSAGSSTVDSPEPVSHQAQHHIAAASPHSPMKSSPADQHTDITLDIHDADVSCVPREASSDSWASGARELMAAAGGGSAVTSGAREHALQAIHQKRKASVPLQMHTSSKAAALDAIAPQPWQQGPQRGATATHRGSVQEQEVTPYADLTPSTTKAAATAAPTTSMFAPALLRSALRSAGVRPELPPTRFSHTSQGSTAAAQLTAAVVRSVKRPSHGLSATALTADQAWTASRASASTISRVEAAGQRLPAAALESEGKVIQATHTTQTAAHSSRRRVRRKAADPPLTGAQARLAAALDVGVCNSLLKMLFARFSCYGDRASTPIPRHTQAMLGLVAGEQPPPSDQHGVPDINVDDVRMRSNQFARLAVACGACSVTHDWPLSVSRSDVDVVFASAMSAMVQPQGSGESGQGSAHVYMWKENAFDIKAVSKSMLRLRIDYGHFTQALLLLATKKYCLPRGADKYMLEEASNASQSFNTTHMSTTSTGPLNASLADTLSASQALSSSQERRSGKPSSAVSHGRDRPLRPKHVDPTLALKLLLLRHLIPLAVRLGFVSATTSVLDRALSPSKARQLLGTSPRSPRLRASKKSAPNQVPDSLSPARSAVPVANIALSDSDAVDSSATAPHPRAHRHAADSFPQRVPNSSAKARKWGSTAPPSGVLKSPPAAASAQPPDAPTPEQEQISAYLERTTYATQHLHAMTHTAVSTTTVPTGHVPGLSAPAPGNRHAVPPPAQRASLPPLAEMLKLIPSGAPKKRSGPALHRPVVPSSRKVALQHASAADKGGHGLQAVTQAGTSRGASITQAASATLTRAQMAVSTVPAYTTAPTSSLAGTAHQRGSGVYTGVPLQAAGALSSSSHRMEHSTNGTIAFSDGSDSDDWGITAASLAQGGLAPGGARQWAPSGPWGSTKAADRDARYGEMPLFLQASGPHEAGYVPPQQPDAEERSAATTPGAKESDTAPPAVLHEASSPGGQWSQRDLDMLPKRRFGTPYPSALSPGSVAASLGGRTNSPHPLSPPGSRHGQPATAPSPFTAGFHSGSQWQAGTSPISNASEDSLQRSVPASPTGRSVEHSAPLSHGRVRFTESAVDRNEEQLSPFSPTHVPITPGHRAAAPKTPATDKAQREWMAQYALSAETKKRLAGYDVDSGDPIGTAYTGEPATAGTAQHPDTGGPSQARSTLRRSSEADASVPDWQQQASPMLDQAPSSGMKALGRQLDYSLASQASRQSADSSFGVHDMHHSPPPRASMAPTPSPAALLARAQNAMHFSDIAHSADFSGVGLLDSTISRAAERTASGDSGSMEPAPTAASATQEHSSLNHNTNAPYFSQFEPTAAASANQARVTISPDGAITILTPQTAGAQPPVHAAPSRTPVTDTQESVHSYHPASAHTSSRTPSMGSAGSSYRIRVDAAGVSIEHFAAEPRIEAAASIHGSYRLTDSGGQFMLDGKQASGQATLEAPSPASRLAFAPRQSTNAQAAHAKPSAAVVMQPEQHSGSSPDANAQMDESHPDKFASPHAEDSVETAARSSSTASGRDKSPPGVHSHSASSENLLQNSSVSYAFHRVRRNMQAAHSMRSSSVLLSSQRTADEPASHSSHEATPVLAVADMSADDAGGPHHASPLPKRAALARYTAFASQKQRQEPQAAQHIHQDHGTYNAAEHANAFQQQQTQLQQLAPTTQASARQPEQGRAMRKAPPSSSLSGGTASPQRSQRRVPQVGQPALRPPGLQ